MIRSACAFEGSLVHSDYFYENENGKAMPILKLGRFPFLWLLKRPYLGECRVEYNTDFRLISFEQRIKQIILISSTFNRLN